MNRLSPDDLDDIKARNPLEAVAGGYVKLRRLGGTERDPLSGRLVGPCPICGGRATSQRFEIPKGGESWVCAVCPDGGDVIHLVMKAEGCDFRSAIERLGGRTEIDKAAAKALFEAREQKRIDREKTAASYREAERKRLYKMWKSRMPVHGSPVETYAAGRGLQLPAVCPGLGYLPSVPYYHGETIDERGRTRPRIIHVGPAMGAAFIRPNGTFGGLHLTWLGVTTSPDDRPGKAEIIDPDSGEILNAKKMRGSKTGAHILIATANASYPRRLIVGEGIETVLAVWTAYVQAGRPIDDVAFWAAGDLGNMAGRATEAVRHPILKRPNGHPMRVPGPMPDPDDSGLSIPDSVEELILLGDGDSEKVLTEHAMMRAARRYTRDGRVIRIPFAPAGLDFNNVLQAAE